ncbi:DNA-processing protein DprA [Microbacterium sp. YY-01]|uniref:Smf/DprA SLOG domain-containing protein n=2 Tax=Microbacterium nanhaiense TaxID=1301026 RepID=A0ABQ2MZF5_9MICO|nr:hypothetical protein GCM10010910_09400 [Microbacterium nanhaiense]
MPTLTDLAKDERSARMVLTIVGTPNDVPTGNLIARVGAVDTVAFIQNDAEIPGVDEVQAAVWREQARIRASAETIAYRLAEGEQYSFITPLDAEWPVQLGDLGSRSPYGLWAHGNIDQLAGGVRTMVTFDGVRAATGYGEEAARSMAGELAYAGYTVVSGGAYGIEGTAHRGALAAGGGTIAVLASGVDRTYPSGHADLFERIRQNGVVVSEHAPGVAPTRQRFLDRSRLLAAFSETTVIVEAGARSGSICTAVEARDLGRTVGAVPGPITSAASTGANLLLQQGRAQLVTNAADVRDLIEHGQFTRQLPYFGSPSASATRETPQQRSL